MSPSYPHLFFLFPFPFSTLCTCLEEEEEDKFGQKPVAWFYPALFSRLISALRKQASEKARSEKVFFAKKKKELAKKAKEAAGWLAGWRREIGDKQEGRKKLSLF